MARIIGIVNAKGGVGKCIAPRTPVLLASGEIVPIDNLFDSQLVEGVVPEIDEEGGIFIKPRTPIQVLSLDEKLKLVKSRVTNLYRGIAKNLLAVRTARGKEVEVTACHPFLVLRDGSPAWIKARGLQVGDFVATPRSFDTISPEQEINIIPFLPDAIHVKINDRRLIEKYWVEILRSSPPRIAERLLLHLAQSPKTSVELRKIANKNVIYGILRKLMRLGLVGRRPQKGGRFFEYYLNQDRVIEYLYQNGFSITAFKKLNFQPHQIQKMAYYNNSHHKCPAINPIIKLDVELARFIAIVIAEGSIDPARIVLYNSSANLIRIFTDYCEKIGLPYSKKRKENQWIIRLNGAGTLVKILHEVFGLPIKGPQKSFRVTVPPLILQSPNSVLAAYLATYIDSEGYVSKNRSTVEIASASRANIIGLQYGLLRFGISSSVRPAVKWATNSLAPKPRTYYRITITGTNNLKKIREQIPLNVPEKIKRLEQTCLLPHNTNNDVVPVAPLLRRLRQYFGISQRYLGLQGTITDYEDGSSAPSRQALAKIAAAFESYATALADDVDSPDMETLLLLGSSDIFWDRIVEIKKINHSGYVYDLTVADFHNFVAGNGAFIIHNTTTANNLGAYLAAKGKYVLLVDLDPQANATAGLGIHLADDHLNLYHSLINDTEPEAIIKKSSLFGFDILPAAESLAGATVELVDLTDREFRLKRVLDKIRTNYDYILIDNPPSLGLLTVNGLVAAEQVLIPVQCEYYALEGLSQLIKTIDLVRSSLNPQLKILGVLLTMFDKRNKLSHEIVKEVRKNFPGYVFETIIPRAVSLAEAPSFGKTILQFDKDSKAAEAYNQLAEEILRLS